MRYLTEDPPRLWRRPRRASRVRTYAPEPAPALELLHAVLAGLRLLAVTTR
jgi:hypothetical protein